MNNPLVSIIIVSYNHVESIDHAIDSVLDQTFKNYKVIIVDDGSTDGSIEIIKRYRALNKNIEVYYETHNGLMQNYLKGFSKCNSKYIAICDCDDYWIDRDKLKKQVEYMENNADCGLCFTLVYTETGELLPMSVSADTINKRMSFDTLLKGRANIHAQSYMIRTILFATYINFQHFIDVGFCVWDYPIVLELIKHTKFHCLDFYSAVFVKNRESVTNTESRKRRFRYLLGNYKIKWYYIKKYGCKVSTIVFLSYKIVRDIYSIIFNRWNRQWI